MVVMNDEKKLEVPEPLLPVGKAFREAGHELYLVGGYVRDRLLGGTHPDIDATTDARPKEIKRLLGPRADHLWTVGERFGTIGSTVGDFAVEVTTYRTDLYTRGSRHPEVRFGKPLDLTDIYEHRGGRETLEVIGNRVMAAIAELAAD